jgi:hypothetical protein
VGVLNETSTFEASVYQLETTDPVAGGPVGANTGAAPGTPGRGDGILNLAARQLANRTRWLYSLILGTGATAGDMLYATGAAALARLGIGAANRVLTSTGSAPAWADAITLGGAIQGGSLRAATGDIRGRSTAGASTFALSVAGESAIELASAAVSSLAPAGFVGLIVVDTNSNNANGSAVFLVNAAHAAVVLIAQAAVGDAQWSNAKDTAARLNLYVEGGLLKVQNNTGAVRYPRFLVLRTS